MKDLISVKQLIIVVLGVFLFFNISFATEITSNFENESWPFPRLFHPDPTNPTLTTTSQINTEIRDRMSNPSYWLNFEYTISRYSSISTMNNIYPGFQDRHALIDSFMYEEAQKLFIANSSDWSDVINALKLTKSTGLNFHPQSSNPNEAPNGTPDFPYDFIPQYLDNSLYPNNPIVQDNGHSKYYIHTELESYIQDLNNDLISDSDMYHKIGTFRGSNLIKMCKTYDLVKASGYLTASDDQIIKANIQRTASELFCFHLMQTGQIEEVLGYDVGHGSIDINHRHLSVGALYTPVALVLAGLVLNDQVPIKPNGITTHLISYCSDPKNWFRQGLGNLRMGLNATDLRSDYHFPQAPYMHGFPSLFGPDGVCGSGQNYGRQILIQSLFAYRAVANFCNACSKQNTTVKFIIRPSFSSSGQYSDDESIYDIVGMKTDLMPNDWIKRILNYYNVTQFPSGQVATFEDCRSTEILVERVYFSKNSVYNKLMIEPYEKELTYNNRRKALYDMCYKNLFEVAALYQGTTNKIKDMMLETGGSEDQEDIRGLLDTEYDQKVYSSTNDSYVSYRSSWDRDNHLFICLTGDHGENNTWDDWHHLQGNGVYSAGEQWANMNINHEQDDNMAFVVMKDLAHVYRDAGYPNWCRNSPLSFANHSNTIEWLTQPTDLGATFPDIPQEPDPIGIAPLPRTDVDIKTRVLDKKSVHSSIMQTSGYYFNNEKADDARLERTIIAIGRDINGTDHSDLMINWDEVQVLQYDNVDYFVYNLLTNNKVNPCMPINLMIDFDQYDAECAFETTNNTGAPKVRTKFLAKTNIAGAYNNNQTYAYPRIIGRDCGDGYVSGMPQDDVDTYLSLIDNYNQFRYKVKRPWGNSTKEINFNVVHGFGHGQMFDGNSSSSNYWKQTGVRLNSGEVGASDFWMKDGTWVGFKCEPTLAVTDPEWFAGRSYIFRELTSSEIGGNHTIENSSATDLTLTNCGKIFEDRGWHDYDSSPTSCRRRLRRIATNYKAVAAYHYYDTSPASQDDWEERVRFVVKERRIWSYHYPKDAVLYYDFNDDYQLTANEKVDIAGYWQNGDVWMIDVDISNTNPIQWKEIPNIDDNLPDKYELGNGYPNPFNAQINIPFALPEASDVKISIYNMMGQKVMDIIDDNIEAGYHNVVWNADGSDGRILASGVYFVKMEAANYLETRKIVLMK